VYFYFCVKDPKAMWLAAADDFWYASMRKPQSATSPEQTQQIKPKAENS
jgi:hypothetical protein